MARSAACIHRRTGWSSLATVALPHPPNRGAALRGSFGFRVDARGTVAKPSAPVRDVDSTGAKFRRIQVRSGRTEPFSRDPRVQGPIAAMAQEPAHDEPAVIVVDIQPAARGRGREANSAASALLLKHRLVHRAHGVEEHRVLRFPYLPPLAARGTELEPARGIEVTARATRPAFRPRSSGH